MKKKNRFYYAVPVVLMYLILNTFCITSSAQITFERNYGGSGTETGWQVRQLSDTGYISAGYTTSFGNGGNDIFVVRTNKYGDTLWTRTYGGPQSDNCQSINPTHDGGFIIAGSTASYGPGSPTYGNGYLLRLDSAGNIVWTQIFGSASYNDNLTYSFETSDHNFITLGNISIGGLSTGAIIKSDSAGNTLWLHSFFTGVNNDVYHGIETADNKYLVTGYKFESSTNSWDLALIKYDTSGVTLISRFYNRAPITSVYADAGIFIQPLADGSFTIAGETGYSTLAYPWFLRVNSILDTLWTQVVNSLGFTLSGTGGRAWSLSATNDGNYIMVGLYLNDIRFVKTDTSCNILWSQTYGSPTGSDRPYDVIATNDGGYIACGYIYTGINLYLIKTDGNGNVLPTSNNTLLNETASDKQFFPNPFTTTATIKFSHTLRSATFRLYNLFGQKIIETSGINGESFRINAETLGSGVYVYEVTEKDKKICGGKAVVY